MIKLYKRDLKIDCIKGLLIVLVVFGHTLQYIAYQGHGFWDDPLFKFIYTFHMPAFMYMSGYLAANMFENKWTNKKFDYDAFC